MPIIDFSQLTIGCQNKFIRLEGLHGHFQRVILWLSNGIALTSIKSENTEKLQYSE